MGGRGEAVSGVAWAGGVGGQGPGEMAGDRLRGKLAVPETPLAAGYALDYAFIPQVVYFPQ